MVKEKSELEKRIDYLEECVKKIIKGLNAMSELQETLMYRIDEHKHVKTIGTFE